MQRGIFYLFSLVLSSLLALPYESSAQSKTKKEIDVGFAPIESVKSILESVLSPNGKFVMLPGKGSVMVIDQPAHIAAAETALAAGALPAANVGLQFAFQTGLPPRRTRIESGREVFFPTAWDPPQIPNIVVGNGPFPITPAHPTGFVKRHIGVTSDTVTTLNPNGTVTVDVNLEHTEFEGFINYGSAIMPAGQIGTVPVNGQAGNPGFFAPLVPNNILMPIISTTRISTSVIVRPRVVKGAVNVDMIPRFTVHTAEEGAEKLDFDLKEFLTTVTVPNNGVGRVYGFANASEDFNRNFLGAKDLTKGCTAIVIKGKILPPQTESSGSSSSDSESGKSTE